MQRVFTNRDEPPMMEIDTTPLIDVLLVLLIMFVITIPIQTHAVKVDLPVGATSPYPPPNSIRNTVVISRAGMILWNDAPISFDGLRYNLALTQRMRPTPELHLRPEPEARYAIVDQVLAATKRAHVEKMGFIGNDRYASF
ncbi:MAG: biopolymer transporter ExbD [Sphingomicrobium sp.]